MYVYHTEELEVQS